MAPPTFEWDSGKATANLNRHGVSFEDAATTFLDPLGKVHSDPDHSASEHREIIVGHSSGGQLLVVSFTDRSGTIRLISARRANRRERHDYEEAK
jgi:uncharacterized DUF497 family protein